MAEGGAVAHRMARSAIVTRWNVVVVVVVRCACVRACVRRSAWLRACVRGSSVRAWKSRACVFLSERASERASQRASVRAFVRSCVRAFVEVVMSVSSLHDLHGTSSASRFCSPCLRVFPALFFLAGSRRRFSHCRPTMYTASVLLSAAARLGRSKRKTTRRPARPE